MKNESGDLKKAILALQDKRNIERKLLMVQLLETYESNKPINLIKNTFKQAVSSSEIKGNLLGNFMGIGTGILSRKLWVGSSHNPIKRLLGTLIQFTMGNVVSKHAKGIKNTVAYLMHQYLPKKTLSDDFQERANKSNPKY